MFKHLPIAAIACMATNHVIGYNNKLPWHLPADLAHFKRLTENNLILMGRKTYASIGKALPNRINFILSRDLNFKAPGCIVINNIQEAFEKAAIYTNKTLFIIGGAEIYQAFLPFTDRIFLTIVQQDFAGDTYFPTLDENQWEKTESTMHLPDEKNAYAYEFVTLKKKK